MAKKKTTRADKVAAALKPNKTNKKTAPKSKAPAKKTKIKTEYESPIPGSTIIAIVSLLLFFLFLVICINPDGKLLIAVKNLMTGLIGQLAFYAFIPVLLYLFLINTFGRRTALSMRNICAIIFVFCFGCMHHLAVPPLKDVDGLSLIPELYLSGTLGKSGGILCGGLAYFLRWACGSTISYILIGSGTVLALLGAMQITIPSLIRAFINRPRDDWEYEDEEQVYIEPAAVVVNHITNRQIEKKHQKRQRQEELLLQRQEQQAKAPAELLERTARKAPVPVEPILPRREPNLSPSESVQASTTDSEVSDSSTPLKAAGMMSTIDLDIASPLFSNPAHLEKQAPQKAAENAAFVPEETEDDYEDLEDEILAPAIPEVPQKETPKSISSQPENGIEKVTKKDAQSSAQQVAMEIRQGSGTPQAEYSFPPVNLLKRPVGGAADGTDEMRENSRRLNETLASFRIDAHITNVTRGPSVTRYEVELDKGVRLNKLTNCADDIALSLGASGVRIAAVPGKISIVGIEVPNRAVTTVSLREVIDSPEFSKAKSKSSFAVGKDIGGSCIVGNISKMPHMLIAGTTGSGKSVCMNSIIISLLYKSSPEDVKLIMVDPKMVELGIYNGIPHLLIPVVTDPKKAAGSLQWAVTEMLRRYKMMSDVGVRDLESYNSIVTTEENGQKLPQVVIIIDELADLMLVAAKEVEDSICRIAQMGRAAGMHLIIATQRPSADVITGLMKANIPSRIAFSVASAMESRIILDTQGAEKLVGKGDMLYAPIGIGKPKRVQGCFVTDSEVEAVAQYVKDHYVADYNQQVLEEIEKKAQQTGKKANPLDIEPSADELGGDEMLPAAVDVILETGQASVSMLQRRLKLGYARAARIVDEMEEKGIVGPSQGSKPRSILVTKEQWVVMRGGTPLPSFDMTENSIESE